MKNTHRSEEHTSELQSHSDLVCRLLLEKKNKRNNIAKAFIREDFYVDDGLLSRPDSNSALPLVRDDNQEHTEA